MTYLRLTFTAGCVALLLGGMSGCGGDDTAEGEAAAPASPESGGETLTAAVQPKSNLQVFFDSPLQIAADQSEAGSGGGNSGGDGNDVTTTGAPSDAGGDMDTAAPAADPPAAAGGAVAWAELMPAELVEASVKNLRNELSKRLVNLGAYNSSFLEISVFGSALSFVAEVGRQHDGDVGWKEKAHMIRALGIAMVEVTGSSTARGKKGYDVVNDAFLTVCEILDGNDPAAPPEAEEEADISESADMAYLMKVIERQLEWMQNNAGSEDAFKEKAELVQREAALMAAIGEAFNSEGYGYGPASNDEEFSAFAYGFRDAAKAMSGAAKSGNFEDFDQQRSAAAQKCVQCHMVYRNG